MPDDEPQSPYADWHFTHHEMMTHDHEIRAAQTVAVVREIADMAFVDSRAFPDPKIANFVKWWVLGFMDADDYETELKSVPRLVTREQIEAALEPHVLSTGRAAELARIVFDAVSACGSSPPEETK
jgi:hypothetical protein